MRLPQPIIVVSDGTGETAEKVIRAALQQFKGHLVHVRTYSHVTREEQLVSLFRIAERQRAFVVSTLVRADMRSAGHRLSREHRVSYVDLIGHLLGALETFLDAAPVGVPGLMHQADEDFVPLFKAVFDMHGLPWDGEAAKALMDAAAIVTTKLKFHFNRPRPFQVAAAIGSPFRPLPTKSGQYIKNTEPKALILRVFCFLITNNNTREYWDHG